MNNCSTPNLNEESEIYVKIENPFKKAERS